MKKFHAFCRIYRLWKCVLSTKVAMQNRRQKYYMNATFNFKCKVLSTLGVRYNLLFHTISPYITTSSYCHTIYFISFNMISFRAIRFTVFHCSLCKSNKKNLFSYFFQPAHNTCMYTVYFHPHFLLIWIDRLRQRFKYDLVFHSWI